MNSLATELFKHKKIRTTIAKAKEARIFAEQLITKAKHASAHEKETGKVDVHARRQVYRYIKDREVIGELFGDIATRTADRNGGYTRVVKLGQRFGDGAEMAILELVDWNAEQDKGAIKKRTRRTRAKQPKKTAAAPAAGATVDATVTEETPAEAKAE
jgi:large subunit ribosomal protein L17